MSQVDWRVRVAFTAEYLLLTVTDKIASWLISAAANFWFFFVLVSDLNPFEGVMHDRGIGVFSVVAAHGGGLSKKWGGALGENYRRSSLNCSSNALRATAALRTAPVKL